MANTYSSPAGSNVLVDVSQLFLPMLDRLSEVRSRRKIRRVFAAMSDRQLHDAGLTWHDICQALALPLECSAQEAIGRASAQAVALRFGEE